MASTTTSEYNAAFAQFKRRVMEIARQSGGRGKQSGGRETRTLSELIREERTTNGLSFATLEKQSGELSYGTIHLLETGKKINPTVRTCIKLARGLGVPLQDVVEAAENSLCEG